MAEKNLFSGSIVPLITPFTKKGAVDFKLLAELTEFQVSEGTDAIVCLGTTGESPTLSHAEKIAVIKVCQKVIKKRIPLIVGTGTYSTSETVAFTKLVKGMRVDGCLVVLPYYNKPSLRGCVEHFRAVAKVGLPVILYHHPGRCGIKLSAAVLAEMYAEKLMVAIKDCSTDFAFLEELKKLSSVPLLSGDNETMIGMAKLGSVGGICVMANIFPREWKEIVTLSLEKKFREAEEKAKKFAELLTALSLEGNPGPVKYAVSLIKTSEPLLRLPMIMPEEKTRNAIREAMSKLVQGKLQTFSSVS